MTERHFIIEDTTPAIFYGVGNTNIRMLRALHPKLRITGRDTVLKVIGTEEDLVVFETIFKNLQAHCALYNSLNEEQVIEIVRAGGMTHRKNNDNDDEIIVYSTSGRAIQPKTEGQRRLVKTFDRNDMLFALGPAGTGKTYIAIALAVKLLKAKVVKRIILSRPAVEAGEKLGFLPGDMKEKIDPYLQPLYDALEEMIPAIKLREYIETGIIQIAPLAFMRGRTLNDAVVILDEAQNTTPAQMRMFLTRMGWNTKIIITGDITQVDLPAHTRSGLVDAIHILREIKGIGIVTLHDTDIVRHKLVANIVKAYAEADEKAKHKIVPLHE